MAPKSKSELVKKDREYYAGLGENKTLLRAFIDSKGKPVKTNRGEIVLRDMPVTKAWKTAINALDYHVETCQLVALLDKGVSTKDGAPDYDFIPVSGKSVTGRGKKFRAQMVDMFRTGEYDAVAVLTEQYESFDIPEVYQRFREALDETGKGYHLDHLFVVPNGGTHELVIEIDKGLDAGKGIPDKLNMKLALTTSIDGSKSHGLQFIVANKDAGGDVDVWMHGGAHRASSRHTKAAIESAQAFHLRLQDMMNDWNATVVPALAALYTTTVSVDTLAQAIVRAVKRTELGKVHLTAAPEYFRTAELKTHAKRNTVAAMQLAVFQYIQEELESRDLYDRVKGQMARALESELVALCPKYARLMVEVES